MELKTLSLYAMAGFYTLAGIGHFVMTKFFMRIMPPYIPWHKPIVYLSGVAEIGLGILLIMPAYSAWAAWGSYRSAGRGLPGESLPLLKRRRRYEDTPMGARTTPAPAGAY
jgi:hypothetical protein